MLRVSCAGPFWDHVSSFEFNHYPGLLLVLLFFRLILLDTSGCERGFSAMNIIKNKMASMIGDGVLSDVMTIANLGPDIINSNGGVDWEPIDIILHNAILYWRKKCSRSLGALIS
jgi:hypothetical protein